MSRVRHELSHAVLEAILGQPLDLKPTAQSYALWEHFADVMAITMKQYLGKDTKNWLIAENLIRPNAGNAKAWRNLADPGNAFSITTSSGAPLSDGCLRHMSALTPGIDRYMKSTIPSFAFYKATVASGRPCWELTSKLWFKAISSITYAEREMEFADFAKKVLVFAKDKEFNVENIVRQAWTDVGINAP